MVYGEPISFPGTLLSDIDHDDDQLRQQRAAVNHLRVEVARLQPMATSAHRQLRVQLPENLREASYVFIRKAGVQPCFTAPYSGPHGGVVRYQRPLPPPPSKRCQPEGKKNWATEKAQLFLLLKRVEVFDFKIRCVMFTWAWVNSIRGECGWDESTKTWNYKYIRTCRQ